MLRETYLSSLEILKGRQDNMTDCLEHWVSINSHSRNLPGLEKMSRELIRAFSVLGIEPEVLPLPTAMEFTPNGSTVELETVPALLWRCRQHAPSCVLFCGHFDTVFTVDSPFQKATIRDGKMHGPGAADMKGGLLVMLEGLRHFEEHFPNPNIGWDILLVPDEETGSHSSSHLFEKYAHDSQLALVYEPSLPDGSLARARKGSGTFNAVVTGHASHVGRSFDEGRSAIVALSRFVQSVHMLNEHIEGAIFNVGRVDGGGPLNVVPDHAAAQFNIRIARPETIHEVDEAIQAIRHEIEADTGCRIRWEGGFTRPPKPCTPGMESLFAQIQQSAEFLGQQLTWKDTGGCCDGNNLAAAGLPCIDTLGVAGAGIHSDQEYMLLDSLPDRAALTALFLHDFARSKHSQTIETINA